MKVVFTVKSKQIGIFFELVSTGIMVSAQIGISIKELLCNQLGIDSAYVDDRIQTVFLDGRAIDDVYNTLIEEGSVLALSGAMPGLAGAVFRKGGILSPMRSNFQPIPQNDEKSVSGGVVVLKMFNQVAADLGPAFLKNGIRVAGKTFRDFLDRKLQDLQKICESVIVDGKEYPLTDEMSVDFSSEDVWLSIKTI